MGYREQGSRITETAEAARLAVLDVSGRAGRRGPDGAPGRSGSLAGEDGQRGADAGEAEAGESAGKLELELSLKRDDPNVVVLGGSGVTANGRRASIQQVARIGERGSIDLFACGGAGGAGGHGGHGGHGAMGSAGSDASRYSRGGDGGPGGDGGDGGRGSSGADGGSGGLLRVTVDEGQMHLLMLPKLDVSGGAGGSAGAHGHGGSGGAGGRGGSSYSWTETESYTDSDGNSQTRSTTHYNSGGSDGPPGRSGAAGSGPLRHGRRGDDGTMLWVVRMADGPRTYATRYALSLRKLTLVNDNEDGIFEPEERVHVRDVVVENVGDMPLPSAQGVELSVERRGYVEPEPGVLVVARGLDGHARQTFKGQELSFVIGSYSPSSADEPLRHEETVRLRAHLPAVRRDFEGFHGADAVADATFVVQFPVELSPLETLHSLAPNETARLCFSIRNVSSKSFGHASALGRRVGFRLTLVREGDDSLGDDEIGFFDETGARVPLEPGERGEGGWERALAELGPGEERAFEGTLAVHPDAPTYRHARLRLELLLGRISAPLDARPVQLRGFSVRVARRYEPKPTDLLLVVNNRTTEAELAAWETLCLRLGLSTNVWDLAREGHLDVSRDDGRGSLGDALAGKTVLVLNNAFDTPRGEMVPTQMIDKAQLHELVERGARVAVVGREPKLEHLLLPTREGVHEPASEELEALLEAARPLRVGESTEPFALHARHLFGKPTERDVDHRCGSIEEALERRYPGRRFLVTHAFEPEPVSSFLGVTRYRVAMASIRRIPDVAAGAVLCLAANDRDVHEPSFVLGEHNDLAMLLMLPFDAKLARAEVLLGEVASADAARPRGKEERSRAERDSKAAHAAATRAREAVLVDLAGEIAAAHGAAARPTLAADGSDGSLARLHRLAAWRPSKGAGPVLPDSALGRWIVELAAELRVLARYQMGWLAWIPPFSFVSRRAKVRRRVRAAVERLLEHAFEAGEVREGARAAVRSREKRLRAEVRSDAGGLPLDERVLARLLAPLERHGLTTDAEVFSSGSERVLGADEWRPVEGDDKKRQRRRKAHMGSMAEARASLSGGRASSELLARASTRLRVAETSPTVDEEEALRDEGLDVLLEMRGP